MGWGPRCHKLSEPPKIEDVERQLSIILNVSNSLRLKNHNHRNTCKLTTRMVVLIRQKSLYQIVPFKCLTGSGGRAAALPPQ